jgi:catechol 2,3-dioxygenase-like lactoylglutathione lyase family enzyme
MNVLKPGINHLELWVSNKKVSFEFYKSILEKLGWIKIGEFALACQTTEIYLNEHSDFKKENSLGIRHICFQATSKEQVDRVAEYLSKYNAKIIRGPVIMKYSSRYYTIDFYDPDDLIIEVSYTPDIIFK